MSDTGRLAIAVAALVAMLLAVGTVGGLGQQRDALVALARAVAQLALVGFVIRLVLLRPAFAPVYLLVMLGAAARTSGRRIRQVRSLARTSAARALVPALDQTRNVGLVVLPGAYVGLLLAGATPAEAGRVQFLVLLGLLVAESIAAVIVTRLLAAPMGQHKPLP